MSIFFSQSEPVALPLTAAMPESGGGSAVAQALAGLERAAHDEDERRWLLENLAQALQAQPADGGAALIEAIAAHENAAQLLLDLFGHDPAGTREVFARLSPIEAVRVLRYFDRQDPAAAEHVLELLRSEDPQHAMLIYAAFEHGGHGGYHRPDYASGGYNSKDGISLRERAAFPQTYSFFRQ